MKRFSRDQLSTAAQVGLILFLLVYSAVKGDPDTKGRIGSNTTTQIQSATALRTQMIALWEQHVVWNRNVMICIVDELPGSEQAMVQLHQNKVEMGDAIKPFYGTEAGNRFIELLDEHIQLSVDVICLVKAGKNTELREANQQWYRNADEIVVFLAEANPYWGRADSKRIIKEQLIITTSQAVNRIQQNYHADLVAFDKANLDAGKMAAVFSDGIEWQFPGRFNHVPGVMVVNNELY